MNAVIVVLVVYLGLLAAFAVWGRRETGTLAGFYLAGKKLPYWVVAFSTNATGESGWLLLGLTGMGYAVGAQAYWVVVGQMIGITLSWGLISRRLKRLSDQHDAITVPDVLAARFDDRHHLIRIVAVMIILTMVLTYMTGQMVAAGKALSSFAGTDYSTGVIAGAAIVIAYTFVGGYKAVSYTDVLQGVLMLAGLVLVPSAAISAAGGLDAVVGTLDRADAALLSMNPADGGIRGWVMAVSFLAVGIPFIGVPQLLVRYMSARDDLEIRKARVVSVIVLFVFTFGAVTAGIAGRALFPELPDQDLIFPTLSKELFPPLVTGVLLVIVLSAIMSTSDSLLLLASSAVVRDAFQKVLDLQRGDRQLAVYGKVVTVVIGVAAMVFAVQDPKFIFWFVLFAWAGLGTAFGPVVAAVLYYRKVTRWGVVAGMLVGFLTSILWERFLKADVFGLYEALPGFIAGGIATLAVSRMTWREPQPVG